MLSESSMEKICFWKIPELFRMRNSEQVRQISNDFQSNNKLFLLRPVYFSVETSSLWLPRFYSDNLPIPNPLF